MDADVRSRITAARNLQDDIARIGGLERQNLGGVSGDISEGNADFDNGGRLHRGGALAVSPPNSLAGRLLKVVVSDAEAKNDLANRLNEAKDFIMDLCDRQMNDLLDEDPKPQADEIDRLLVEMRSVRRCMETMVALERALHRS